jgi:hypothetical protein
MSVLFNFLQTEEKTMAHGSSKAMRAYVNKIFNLEERLLALEDVRRAPSIPWPLLLLTWFWAMAKQMPSTQQVGQLLRDVRWQKKLGFFATLEAAMKR